MMIEEWTASRTTAEFSDYDNLEPRVFGHPFVFNSLRLPSHDVNTLLDYGCGPGWVSLSAARLFDVRVVAVDPSPTMISYARRYSTHPCVDYQPIAPGNRISFLKEGQIDAAMCCSVLTCVGSKEEILRICVDVHRTLKPGGIFAIMENNPATVGVQFSHVRCGEPGLEYDTGQQRKVYLRGHSGRIIEANVYHWSVEDYTGALVEAGFEDVLIVAPLLADAIGLADEMDLARSSWEAERISAPYLTISGTKPYR